ncbi:MAG: HAD family hydrolase [Bacteroidetes bacterium]|nr:HAD family hydrolase [Bacteroidota bacterium]
MQSYRAVLYSMSALMGESYEDEEILENQFSLGRNELKELRQYIGPRKWRSRVLSDIKNEITVAIQDGKETQIYPDTGTVTRVVLNKYSNTEPSDELVENIIRTFNRVNDFTLSQSSLHVVQTIFDRNYMQSILSNSIIPARMYAEKLKQLGIGHYFDTVLCSSDLGVSKPNPEFFAMALEAMGLNAQDVLFIADNIETDVAGAASMGIPTILVNRYTQIPELPGNVALVHDIKQILDYLPQV